MKPNGRARRSSWRLAPWSPLIILALIVGGWILIRQGFAEFSFYAIAVVYMVLPLVVVCGMFMSVVAFLLLLDRSRTGPIERVGKIVWSGDEKHVRGTAR